MTDELRFAKYQASGNDFVIVDELDASAPAFDPALLCDRWTGVGADGVIRQIALSWGTWTYAVTYSELGTTAAPTAPEGAESIQKLRSVR